MMMIRSCSCHILLHSVGNGPNRIILKVLSLHSHGSFVDFVDQFSKSLVIWVEESDFILEMTLQLMFCQSSFGKLAA
jgi:hypothetical protein